VRGACASPAPSRRSGHIAPATRSRREAPFVEARLLSDNESPTESTRLAGWEGTFRSGQILRNRADARAFPAVDVLRLDSDVRARARIQRGAARTPHDRDLRGGGPGVGLRKLLAPQPAFRGLYPLRDRGEDIWRAPRSPDRAPRPDRRDPYHHPA